MLIIDRDKLCEEINRGESLDIIDDINKNNNLNRGDKNEE